MLLRNDPSLVGMLGGEGNEHEEISRILNDTRLEIAFDQDFIASRASPFIAVVPMAPTRQRAKRGRHETESENLRVWVRL